MSTTTVVEIPFAGQLTESEYREVQRLSTPWIVGALPWLTLAMLGLVCVSGGLSVILANPGDQLPRVGLGLAFAVFMYVMPRRAVRKSWQTNVNLQAPFSGELSDVGLAWHGAFVEGRFPWSALQGYRCNAQIVLVYTSERQAVWLLQRFFRSSEEWLSARALVRKHLKAR